MPSEGSRKPRSTDEAGIEGTAADWLARRQEGLTADERVRLETWIAEEPRHAAAFARMEETWESLSEPRRVGQGDELDRALRGLAAGRRRRHVFAAGVMGLAASLVIGLLLYERAQRPDAAPIPAIALRPLRQVLPDGSVVELNADAGIEVAYTPGKRVVRLIRGEALFQVAKNKERPFVVIAGQLEVTAVGTAFSVRHAGGEVGVLVTEGKVSVERPVSATPDAIYLTAGDHVVVAAGEGVAALPRPEKFSPDAIRQSLAWRGMRVEFTGTTLADAVAILNRRNSLQLKIGDASLAQLQLTGIFWADDAEGFVRLLGKGMNVRADRAGDVIWLRQP